MSNPLIVFLGVAAGLGVGYAMFKGGGGNLLESVHKMFQKKKQEEIKEIEEKQKGIKAEITTKEKISKDSQKKIKDIQEKAASEIEEVLKEENISNIHKTITNDWEDI